MTERAAAMFGICITAIMCLGLIMYVAWRAGSDTTTVDDDSDDYGAPHG